MDSELKRTLNIFHGQNHKYGFYRELGNIKYTFLVVLTVVNDTSFFYKGTKYVVEEYYYDSEKECSVLKIVHFFFYEKDLLIFLDEKEVKVDNVRAIH